MKKTMLILALSLVIGTASFANNDETINQKAQESFRKEFAQAKDVQWQKSGNMTKATFTLNESVLFAYYNDQSDLVAITRNITTDRLPMSLLSSLKKHYADYWITDLFEMVSGGETTYYISIENADHKVVLKSDGFTDWASYRREKKEAA